MRAISLTFVCFNALTAANDIIVTARKRERNFIIKEEIKCLKSRVPSSREKGAPAANEKQGDPNRHVHVLHQQTGQYDGLPIRFADS